MRRAWLVLGIVVPALFSARAARAVNSGILTNTDASGVIPFAFLAQQSNESLTIQTTNLAGGPLPDTVLHVQDWTTGAYVDGNDDDPHGGLGSYIFIPATGVARNLAVVIRAWDTPRYGTCTLAVSSSLGNNWSSNISFGGTRYSVGDLALGTHVTTAERQGGTTDTVIVVVTGNSAHAVGFDDDAGVAAMSWMHLGESCLSCNVFVGNYSYTGTLKTNLVWDGDADGTDLDCDGLGASLEAILGTTSANTPPGCPQNNPNAGSNGTDSDQDGLTDGAELLGFEAQSPPAPVKLPAWGADPLQKDLFWEVDWKKCNIVAQCPQGDDSGKMGAGLIADADFQAQRIEPIKALMAAPGVRVHLDVGRANSNSATWTEWGAWGGATQRTDASESACSTNGSSPERAYMFHYGLGWAPDSAILGAACFVPGPTFNIMANDVQGFVHETGHGLGLQHGGRPGAGSINFKPNYVSIMNYMYSDKGFSHGGFPIAARVLNPTAVKENPGLDSTASTDTLSRLRDAWCPVTPYSSGTCVNVNGNVAGVPVGAVDWNRDGVYEAANVTVQGAVNQAFAQRSARTTFQPAANGGAGVLKDPALAWVSVGGSVGDQLWIFGRDDMNQLVWARTPRTTLDAGCNSFTSFYDESNWNCATFGNTSNPPGINGTTTVVTGSNVLTVAPGAAEYNAQILVVFNRTNQTIRSKLITINSTTGAVSYGSDVTLPGNWTAAGDITALKTASNQVTVWAPVNTPQRKLMEWRYTSGVWAGGQTGGATPDIQKWSEDGTDVNPMWGIGATRGYQDNSPTAQTYAAIATNPSGLVEFARKSGTNTWTKVTLTCPANSFGCVAGVASSWAGTGGSGLPPNGTQPMARARPGLAYQQKGGQANNYVGRFYMAINQGSSCSGPFGTPQSWENPPCEARLIMTEGNVATGTPTNKRLTWISPTSLYEPGTASAVANGISLADDLTRDKNLRAAFDVFGGPNHGLFEPLADGIVNVNLSDFDDYPYVTGALRASLCLVGGTWPGQCTLPGGLQ